MRDKRVYIAAPYSHPDPAQNVRNAVRAADEIIWRTDWLPFVPHLAHLWHLITPRTYEFWLRMNQDWLRACHALVRLGGASAGADADADCAVELGIPVFMSMDEFIAWTKEGA